MPYLKGDGPSMLETFVPKITEAYVASRCVTPPPPPFRLPSPLRPLPQAGRQVPKKERQQVQEHGFAESCLLP